MKRHKDAGLTAFLMAYAIVALVLVNGFVVQGRIDAIREEEGHLEQRIEISPVEFIGSGLMGGFRSLAVDYLWIKIANLQMAHRYYEIQNVADLITKLQPNFPTVWVFNAVNLAYNVSVEWSAREDRWKWIRQGIDTAKRGLAKNPDSVDLEFCLGWMYFHKTGDESADPAHYWLMEQVKKEEGEEALLLAAMHFARAKNLGTHPIFSHRVLEMQEVAALQKAVRYLLLEKPKREEGDVQKGFDALAKSVDLAGVLAKRYPDHEGFRNQIMGFCMEALPALMLEYPEAGHPELAAQLTDALAELLLVVQSYDPKYRYVDRE